MIQNITTQMEPYIRQTIANRHSNGYASYPEIFVPRADEIWISKYEEEQNALNQIMLGKVFSPLASYFNPKRITSTVVVFFVWHKKNYSSVRIDPLDVTFHTQKEQALFNECLKEVRGVILTEELGI